MLTVRYNFETNSSSMHSLAIRTDATAYSEEELRRCESLGRYEVHDAVIILKDEADKTYPEKLYDYTPYKNSCCFFSHDVDFRQSAMSVQCTFYDKMAYLMSLAMSDSQYQDMLGEIQEAANKFWGANIEFDTRYIHGEWFGVNTDIVGRVIRERNIPVYDFLSDPRYMVIVNVEEFFKMQWLNMVDMSQVSEIVSDAVHNDARVDMDIRDGVWHLSRGDITFGRSPYRVLGSVEGKIRYALASGNANMREELMDIIREIYPEIKDVAFPVGYDGRPDYGYAEDSCLPTAISLKEFILNKKYVVIADGDEYCIWRDFQDTPLFNASAYERDKNDD